MKRIILITGSTETLGYFSKQMGIYLYKSGRDVFYWDMEHPTQSIEAFRELTNPSESILVTFNFLGLSGEGQCGGLGESIWDEYGIKKICIMVDSPIYYFEQLSWHIPDLSLVCIDKNHADYMSKWYPEYKDVIFIPLKGNVIIDDKWTSVGVAGKDTTSPELVKAPLIPYDERHIDLVFIGNYVPLDSILPAVDKTPPEYRQFILDICDEMINNPDLDFEHTLERRVMDMFPDEAREDYPEAFYHMVYIDLYVRSFFRGNVIKALTESGIHIFCVGQDWDCLPTQAPENIRYTSHMMSSLDCVMALRSARCSINVMPWFKAGAHDRIFSSMLAGCTTITDSSLYLDEIINPWDTYVPFSLKDRGEMVENVHKILKDKELACTIASKGHEFASKGCTWMDFIIEIENKGWL